VKKSSIGKFDLDFGRQQERSRIHRTFPSHILRKTLMALSSSSNLVRIAECGVATRAIADIDEVRKSEENAMIPKLKPGVSSNADRRWIDEIKFFQKAARHLVMQTTITSGDSDWLMRV
jgi:hypothetical protein